MRIRRRTAWIGFVVILLLIVGVVMLYPMARDSNFGLAVMDVREKAVVGHELRLIVVTSCLFRWPLAASGTTKDVKGYLVIVDLTSKSPIEARSHVYGPLWDVPQPRSEISFGAGANYSQEDEDAALATPHFAFDENGELIRFRTDIAHGKILFDRLDLNTLKYKDSAEVTPIHDNTGFRSDDRVITPSGRYMLLYQNGVARLYDLYSGREIIDPWLTNRFAESRRLPNFITLQTFLTDDLDHLVISPYEFWNDGTGNAGHTTFVFGGKTLSRAEYFLCADRPEPSLGLVKRTVLPQDSRTGAPGAVFTIDHKLTLMRTTPGSILLYRRDGTTLFHTEAKVPTGWDQGSQQGSRGIHLPSQGKLIFFGCGQHRVQQSDIEADMTGHVEMSVWDYRRNIATSEIVPAGELFSKFAGHYSVAVDVTPVK